MTTRITNYIIWGVKLPEFDHDKFEELMDEYRCDRYSYKAHKVLNRVDDIALVTTGMDDFDYIAGHVHQMADLYEGEGFYHQVIHPFRDITPEQSVWIDGINALCGKLKLPHPKAEEYGYRIFTQYM
jgi:hypothetical protein